MKYKVLFNLEFHCDEYEEQFETFTGAYLFYNTLENDDTVYCASLRKRLKNGAYQEILQFDDDDIYLPFN